MSEQFENVVRSRVNNLTVMQEWPLTIEHCAGKSLIISLGGDGTFLRTSSMIDNCETPILGINTDPGRSLGILCSKFLYKDRSKDSTIHKIFDQLEAGEFRRKWRQRMMCKVTQLEKYNEDDKEQYEKAILQGSKISCADGNKVIEKLMLNEVFMAEKDPSKTS